MSLLFEPRRTSTAFARRSARAESPARLCGLPERDTRANRRGAAARDMNFVIQ
ncbi:hypothetical protein C7S16_5049 [Burkholderia thailandensis]|uniref:Uncharacterized protein n=1 Tax=Burkholderia thailandensis TaxID=57975 RepID=A0AAW9CML9_BURTH|nr:hypothetical protein [Burkholderia thailandensis]